MPEQEYCQIRAYSTSIRFDSFARDVYADSARYVQRKGMGMNALMVPLVGSDARHMLAVRLGNEQFAIEVEAVREIMRYQPLTPVPGAAGWILGVLIRHGILYPVVDIRHLIGVPPSIDPRPHRIVLLHHDDLRVAVGVDAVLDILPVDDNAMQPVPHSPTAALSQFIAGVVRHEGHAVAVLNLVPLLAALRAHG